MKSGSAIVKKILQIKSESELKTYMESYGAKRLINEMNSLHGNEYATFYLHLLSLVKDKLPGIEVAE
jgi:hypothetical protein